MSAITIVNCPSASTEIDINMRTAFDLTNAASARVQCPVITPVAGAKITLKYSLDNGATWAKVSAGGTGPFVSVATAGDQQGDALNIVAAAKADVLLSLFVSGGDTLTSLVIGNASALVYVKTEEGDEVVIDEPIGGCALESGFSSESFIGTSAVLTTAEQWMSDRAPLNPPFTTGFGVVQEFFGYYTARPLPSGTELFWYLDTVNNFNGNPTLAGIYRSDDPNGVYGVGTVGYFDRTHAGAADFTSKMVFQIPSDFDITGLAALGWNPPGSGLALIEIVMNDAPGGTNGAVDAWLCIREGRLFLDTKIPSATVVTDLGSSTRVATGEWMQLLWRVEVLSDTSVRMSLYLDTACPLVPTLLHQVTLTVTATTGRGVKEVYTWNWQMDETNIVPSPRTVRTAQIGATYTASNYGL